MIKIGDKVRLVKKGEIGHCFKLGKVYKVVVIVGKNTVVTDGEDEQMIETECFQPVTLEEIIYDE